MTSIRTKTQASAAAGQLSLCHDHMPDYPSTCSSLVCGPCAFSKHQGSQQKITRGWCIGCRVSHRRAIIGSLRGLLLYFAVYLFVLQIGLQTQPLLCASSCAMSPCQRRVHLSVLVVHYSRTGFESDWGFTARLGRHRL